MNEAHIMTLQEVRDVLNFPKLNPTVSAMIFVETRKTAKSDRKLFPCYPIRYDEESNKLIIAVAQCSADRYFFGYVDMPREDIGVKCRFWSGVPSVETMDADPLPDSPEIPKPEEKDNVTIEEVPPQ